MGGFGDTIKYLYEKFILRDLLSFITPGAIVVLTAFVLFLPEPCLSQRLDTLFEYSREMHWLLYIPLFGLFFMVGFAIQCFGEMMGYIHTSRKYVSCCRQRCKIFYFRKWRTDDNDSIIWWVEAHKEDVEFNKHIETYNKKWAQQQDERLVVLMQMCINSFQAIIVAVIFLIVDYYCRWNYANVFIVSLTSVLILLSLFWGYRVHLLRQDTMRKAILHEPMNGKKET